MELLVLLAIPIAVAVVILRRRHRGEPLDPPATPHEYKQRRHPHGS
ncbi:hypothetical protein [Nocardia huaxiensis]|uniref:Uncharacterized protein n=1 Tax=Nocardia huaxiensis TaxID=2755382 RepID=A0A7D6V9X5_9NOCA|nr:hypothetical protein [Nocardia huaxiensis]QLY29202.1 hypothetical protein H0264_28510 [Nocardia huaxiensis]UFS97299.1 hypothetical protein LPY97_05095 [Nocardia huaxiensis]